MSAQEAAAPADAPSIVPAWDSTRWQPHDAPLELILSRPLRRNGERLAVLVGSADLTALVDMRGTRARISLRGERLPAETEVEAWLIDDGGRWHALGRFPVRRLTRRGFETAAARPRFDVQSDGQLDAGAAGSAPPPSDDGSYQRLTMNGGVEGRLRRGGWTATWSSLLAGASHTQARLRAAQLGTGAPPVDLAAYNVRVERGPVALALGHVTLGEHRLLASQFRSRGIAAEVALSRRLTLSAGTAAGAELVGWDDPLGLARPAHRVATGRVSLEAAPSRPGLLRLELTALSGSRQPVPAFTQQAVTDRETSRGLGAQLSAADPSQRLRLTMGLARSRFANPADPALAGDSTLVPVVPASRTARFGEIAVDALRGARIGSVAASLSLALRHERADPLYRTLGAFVQADRRQDAVDLTGALGPLQWQAGALRARDNLDDVPSLLITRTRGYTATAAMPLGALIRAAPTAWGWPSLTVSWQGTTQRGDTTPPNGGFRAPFQIPDQYTGALAVAATWQRAAWNASYRYARSVLDNRQPDRERADFITGVHGVALGYAPGSAWTLMLDLSAERQHNVETALVTSHRRFGAQGDWRPRSLTTLSAAGGLVRSRDPAVTQRARSGEWRLEASQGFNLWVRPRDGAQARAFIRWSRSDAALRVAGVRQPGAMHWSVNTGLSLRVFSDP